MLLKTHAVFVGWPFIMENSEVLVGSWFSTGYHGHFRNNQRNDYPNSYRYFAKPSPPNKFLDRSKMRSDRHLFSTHDNRNSHLTNMTDLEIHFKMGLGRKRMPDSQRTRNTSNLLRWSNSAGGDSGYVSSYKNEYITRNQKDSIDKYKLDKSQNNLHQEFIEPIHIRKNPNLQRRFLSAKARPDFVRAPPLLAWADNNVYQADVINNKPCVGNPMKRTITRTTYDDVNVKTLLNMRQ